MCGAGDEGRAFDRVLSCLPVFGCHFVRAADVVARRSVRCAAVMCARFISDPRWTRSVRFEQVRRIALS